MADPTAAKLLDFSGPFDTPLLEQTVAAFYTGSPEQVSAVDPERGLERQNLLERGSWLVCRCPTSPRARAPQPLARRAAQRARRATSPRHRRARAPHCIARAHSLVDPFARRRCRPEKKHADAALALADPRPPPPPRHHHHHHHHHHSAPWPRRRSRPSRSTRSRGRASTPSSSRPRASRPSFTRCR